MKKLLLIILLGMAWHSMPAQSFFNKRYTLNSFASVLTSVIARDGKYYCTGISWDSSNYIDTVFASNVWGIRFAIFDTLGNIIKDTIYQKAYSGGHNMYAWNNSLYSMPDKSFLLAVTNDFDTANNLYLEIIRFDSLGNVLMDKEFPKTLCPDDQFWNITDMKPTGTGEWLVLSTNGCDIKDNMLLTKLDSSFNIEWNKQYTDATNDYGGGGLLIEPDGYLLGGGKTDVNLTLDNFNYYAQLIKVDTAGNQLWSWTRPGPKYTWYIKDIIRTADGGYIYCGMGDGYWDGSDLAYKGWIERLDSSRHSVWVDSFGALPGDSGENLLKVIKLLPDSSMVVAGAVAGGYNTGDTQYVNFGALIKLNQQGQVIWKRKYSIPGDTLKYVVDDMKPTPDGGFILSGEATQYVDVQDSDLPIQRGLLIKVDSNGCLGPDDPQCQPEGVNNVPEALSRLNIYPNPAHSSFTVSYKLVNNEDAVLDIADITGKQVQSINLSSAQNYTVVNCAAWASGVYIYRVVQEGKVINTGKLVRY